MGADHAIDYRTQDFAAEVWRLTSKRGVDVVLDIVSGTLASNATCRSLAPEGRLAQIAFLQGSKVEVDLRHIMMKRLTVTGSTLRASPQARRWRWLARCASACGRCSRKANRRSSSERRSRWTRAAKAHALMESGALIGKIILQVAEVS